MNHSLQRILFWPAFNRKKLSAVCKLFLMLYIPVSLTLTILCYGIFQMDKALQLSFLEIHSLSKMEILTHLSAYYAISLALLFVVVGYLSVIIVNHRRAIEEIKDLYDHARSSTLFDMTTRQSYEKKIYELAYHDVLTGLPNRQLLWDRINQGLAKVERSRLLLAVLFLDLDKFKQVNDHLGHDIGDELLKIIAVRVSALLRESDTVARAGGDEFIIVLPEINESRDAASVAQKIIAGIGTVIYVKGYQLDISASIGIACYPADGENAIDLMKKADIAMYAAKAAGGNRYHLASS